MALLYVWGGSEIELISLEQQEGGLGRVPKAFVAAQMLAEQNGNITRQKKKEIEDPDVKFLGVDCKTATLKSECCKKPPSEVIDLL